MEVNNNSISRTRSNSAGEHEAQDVAASPSGKEKKVHKLVVEHFKKGLGASIESPTTSRAHFADITLINPKADLPHNLA